MTDKVKGIEVGCQAPLNPSELGSFELTPDGVLYLDEFTGEELSCFTWRYLMTQDAESRNTFRNVMKNGPWEAVRDQLVQLGKGEKIPDELKERHKYILDNEFVEKEWKSSFGLKSDVERMMLDQPSLDGRIRQNDLTVKHSAVMTLDRLLVFSKSKLKLNLSPTVTENHFSQDIESEDAVVTNRLSLGLKLAGGADCFARDDSWGLSASGSKDQTVGRAVPDLQRSANEARASGQLRNLFSSPMVADAAVNWSEREHEPPVNPDFNSRSHEEFGGTSQLSYQNRDMKLGGYWRLDGKVLEDSDFIRKADQKRLSSSLLTQLRLNSDDTLRVGGGGGIWNENFDRMDSGESGNNFGSEAHLETEISLKIDTWFESLLSGLFQHNKSEGTFNGWYPSWKVSAVTAFNLSKRAWRLSLGVTHKGHEVDLNEDQSYRNLKLVPTVEYTPNDKFKLSAKGEFELNRMSDFEAFSQHNSLGQLSLEYRIGSCFLSSYAYFGGGEWSNSDKVEWKFSGGGLGLTYYH